MGHNSGMEVVLGCALLGLLSGSFANVVIRRLCGGPSGDGLVRRGWCVPRRSWLITYGGGKSLSVQLGMALAFGAVGARVGLDWALPGFLLFTWTLLVIAVIDAGTRRIPNRLTYPLTPALLALLAGAALLNGEPGWAARALLAGVVAFGALLTVALASPRGMGMGDVKLAAFIGVGLGYLGWGELVVGVFAGFVLGGLIAIGLLITRLRERGDLIPFGPYLAAGAFLALLTGGPLVEAYVRRTGLG